MSLLPLGTSVTYRSWEMGFCPCTRTLCSVSFSFWQKRASGRLFERSRIVRVWQMTELVSTAVDFLSHRGQVNLVSAYNLCCVFGVIIATSDNTVESRILLETICGHHCGWYDPWYRNSVRDAMTPVSSSSSLCCCEWKG